MSGHINRAIPSIVSSLSSSPSTSSRVVGKELALEYPLLSAFLDTLPLSILPILTMAGAPPNPNLLGPGFRTPAHDNPNVGPTGIALTHQTYRQTYIQQANAALVNPVLPSTGVTAFVGLGFATLPNPAQYDEIRILDPRIAEMLSHIFAFCVSLSLYPFPSYADDSGKVNRGHDCCRLSYPATWQLSVR